MFVYKKKTPKSTIFE